MASVGSQGSGGSPAVSVLKLYVQRSANNGTSWENPGNLIGQVANGTGTGITGGTQVAGGVLVDMAGWNGIRLSAVDVASRLIIDLKGAAIWVEGE